MSEQTVASKRIAIIGAGPSGLFVYKHFVERGVAVHLEIFEARDQPGAGMPYSAAGAGTEHITNVSCNEIPPLVTPILEWLESLDPDVLATYDIDPERFSEHRVLPRLLFGDFLANQFALLKVQADKIGVETVMHTDTAVSDVIDEPEGSRTVVVTSDGHRREFDAVILCTGHTWPAPNERHAVRFFDSPYPPHKLELHCNHAVAIRGSSLTAVDAIRTLARSNGRFVRSDGDTLAFEVNDDSPDFRIVMHSRHGLLPCVRFHTESPQLSNQRLIPDEEVEANMRENDGFLSLDFVFERNFMEPLQQRDPDFHERVRNLRMEEFVDEMLSLRESVEPFAFLKGEYAEAKKSFRRKEGIHWKEMLSALSYAMNYPAKYMSAEDMYRHRHVLMPLISIVIAFLPQSSCEEMIAMHDAGRLDIVSVGEDSDVSAGPTGGATISFTDDAGLDVAQRYGTFVDCIGQRHLSLDAFPFPGLLENGSMSPARLQFRSGNRGAELAALGNDDVEKDDAGRYFSRVSGAAITDDFQLVDRTGIASNRIYLMAVPFIGGFNPDYSGLDFCDQAGGRIVDSVLSTH